MEGREETRVRISDAVPLFLNYLVIRKGRAESTIITYRSMLGLFVKFIGDIEISQMTIRVIDRYADSLKLKPRALANRLKPVRSFVSFLYAKNYTNIRAEAIDIPKLQETEANFLDYEEQRAMMAACGNQQERAIVLVLLRSGLRISELIGLEVSDVFERSIVVHRGKGGKTRVAFMTEEASDALTVYVGDRTSGLIFKLSRQYVHRLIVQVAVRAKINKRVSPHTLRHTFATNMLRAGGGR